MTDKQRFLVYAHLSYLLAAIKRKKNIGMQEAISFALNSGILGKIEDIETGYYLESDAYLENEFLPNCSSDV